MKKVSRSAPSSAFGKRGAMGSHQRPNEGATNTWLTPPAIIAALGPFDLDPCAAIGQPWQTATTQYTKHDDGRAKPWFGRVWLNPPYGRQIGYWLDRLAEHGDGIALVFARTETAAFQRAARVADAILFHDGRLFFHRIDGSTPKGNAGAPSCFLAFGERNVVALERSGLPGFLSVPLGSRRAINRSLFAENVA